MLTLKKVNLRPDFWLWLLALLSMEPNWWGEKFSADIKATVLC